MITYGRHGKNMHTATVYLTPTDTRTGMGKTKAAAKKDLQESLFYTLKLQVKTYTQALIEASHD